MGAKGASTSTATTNTVNTATSVGDIGLTGEQATRAFGSLVGGLERLVGSQEATINHGFTLAREVASAGLASQTIRMPTTLPGGYLPPTREMLTPSSGGGGGSPAASVAAPALERVKEPENSATRDILIGVGVALIAGVILK